MKLTPSRFIAQLFYNRREEYRLQGLGKLPPGLVVNVEDSRSEPWSLDMGLNRGITLKLDGKMDHLMAEKVTKK